MSQRRYDCNDGLFSEHTERGVYWLGFCVADGHVGGKWGWEVQLQLAAKDRETLESFKAALETDHPIYDYWNRVFPKSSLYVTSERLASSLLGFSGEVLRSLPRELHHHFVRGLFDGDGTVVCRDYEYDGVKTYHRKISICGDEEVLQAVRDVARPSGISEGNLALRRGIYYWTLQGIVNIQQFCGWLYKDATIFMPRKKEGFMLLDRTATPIRRKAWAERF